MTWLVITGISIAEALLHYALHHKAQVVMAVVGAAGWVGNRTHIPLLAAHTGGHRPRSRKVRRALRQDHKAAMKQARILADLGGEAVTA